MNQLIDLIEGQLTEPSEPNYTFAGQEKLPGTAWSWSGTA